MHECVVVCVNVTVTVTVRRGLTMLPDCVHDCREAQFGTSGLPSIIADFSISMTFVSAGRHEVGTQRTSESERQISVRVCS
ncbi:unnamed protein product [Protopolystoma xenopodis]|uniref:Uncharacterized protein n=1 Tax=Protopolystoma xenopodis TaxID=117903 RepID=A0A448X186_9PLAT|nr:unnamed protein product [Protopolystoma xenopodis]